MFSCLLSSRRREASAGSCKKFALKTIFFSAPRHEKNLIQKLTAKRFCKGAAEGKLGHVIPIIGVKDYAKQFLDGRGYHRASRIPETLQAMTCMNKGKN
jgi:hypothetical protein